MRLSLLQKIITESNQPTNKEFIYYFWLYNRYNRFSIIDISFVDFFHSKLFIANIETT